MAQSLLDKVLAKKGSQSLLKGLTEEEATRMMFEWPFVGRPEQLPPSGDWRFWLVLAGRGFGKTRAGAEYVRMVAESGKVAQIHLVGATVGACRDIMVEGESGILKTAPSWFKPHYHSTKRKLEWPNGVVAYCFSADVPERLRGPQCGFAWCDELALWQYAEAWTQLKFGLRLGDDPRCIITTTPRPKMLVRELRDDPLCVVTGGSTHDNKANLAKAFTEEILKRYEGTTLGEQEIYAQLLDEMPGALWKRADLDEWREYMMPNLTKTIVAVDPATTATQSSDECGVIGMGLGFYHSSARPHVYVLRDSSGIAAPGVWARRAIDMALDIRAEYIVAEKNQGGDMVSHTIKSMLRDGEKMKVKLVHASKGKQTRAEPVAALYEQGMVHHVGTFRDLEDQLCNYDGSKDEKSPDRMDALVWGISDLMLKPSSPRVGVSTKGNTKSQWQV